MGFTVIIPTMWKANEYLFAMLEKYEQSSDVGEVLIVNNAKPTFSMQLLARFSKVRLIGKGNNILVNPAWNLAVEQAKNDKLLIANDDINILGFSLLIKMLSKQMAERAIYGFSPNCFSSQREKDNMGLLPVKIEQCIKYTLTYGFGVCMALHKKDYIPIEPPMLVWFGDMFLYAQLMPYHIHGFDVLTPMSVTTRSLDLAHQRVIEFDHYNKNRHLFQKLNQ